MGNLDYHILHLHFDTCAFVQLLQSTLLMPSSHLCLIKSVFLDQLVLFSVWFFLSVFFCS